MQENIELEKDKTTAAFRQLHKFLEEQEKKVLAQKEEVAKEIARRRDEYLAILSGELSSLDSFIQEVEEKQQQTGSELLKTSGDILESCKNKKPFENPVVFPVALMWRIFDSDDITRFLEGIMEKFKENLESGLQLQEENVSLDPDTADPSLTLSEDCKSARCEFEQQDLPNNPERFEEMPYVLGQKGFKAGRHFWEVVVGSEEEWSVGVFVESPNGDDEDGIYEMGMWAGEYRVPVPPDDPVVPLCQDLKKIRVTVNYPGKRVAFFNGDTGTRLVRYENVPFGGETIFPCFNVAKRGHLTLCPQAEDSRDSGN